MESYASGIRVIEYTNREDRHYQILKETAGKVFPTFCWVLER
jgi:hypothetical protein